MTHMFDKFLQYTRYERNLSPLTVKAYGSDLRQFGDFLTGGKRPLEPRSVTASDVRAWMVDLARRHDGARTMRRKIQALRAYYKWLLRRGDVAADPTAGLELAKLPRVLPCYLRESTLDALLDSPVDTADYEAVRDRLIVMMLYDTGMRRAELIGLRDAASCPSAPSWPGPSRSTASCATGRWHVAARPFSSRPRERRCIHRSCTAWCTRPCSRLAARASSAPTCCVTALPAPCSTMGPTSTA